MHHFVIVLLILSFMFPFSLGVSSFLQWESNISRRLMVVLLFNTALLYFFNYLYFIEDYDFYLPLHSLHAGIEFSIFPLIYLYMKSITQPRFEMRKEWYHFLPFVIITLVATYLFYSYAGEKPLAFFLLKNRLGYIFAGQPYIVLKLSRYIHLSLIALQAIVYSVAFNRTPVEYNSRLRNEFSNIESFSIDWINRYNLSFAGAVAVGFVLYAFVPLQGYKELLVVFALFLFSVFICVIGIISLKHQKAEVDLDEIDPKLVVVTEINEVADTTLIQNLLEYMINKKVYLQPDLNLTQLSRELGTNRTYLSRIINQQLGTNFCSFVNQYRIQEINQYVKDHPHVSNQELAEMAGFGSVSSMKRAMENKSPLARSVL